MSTIARLAENATDDVVAAHIESMRQFQQDLLQARAEYAALERREKGLLEALRRIAYMQQDICSPPIMSEAEAIRRKAVAALAAHSAQEKTDV